MLKFYRYLYFRMYKAYEKSNEDTFRAFTFIKLLIFITLSSIFIVIRKFFYFDFLINGFVLLILFVLTLLIGERFFSRAIVVRYEDEFSTYSRLNRYLKPWMIAILPVIIFVSAVGIAVLLKSMGFVSPYEEVICIKNETDSKLTQIQLRLDGGRVLFSQEKLAIGEEIEFDIDFSYDETADGRFKLEYYVENAREKEVRYFGYYTSGSMGCEKYFVKIGSNRLVEECVSN